MIITEKKQNLFDTDKKYTLAHCISSDFKMGAGIAREFTARGVKSELFAKYNNSHVGDALLTHATGWQAEINLVTKEKYWLKPDYDTLRASLLAMKNIIIANKYNYIAIPRIGCGLDRLDWDKTKAIIINTFSDLNIEILVCNI